MKRLILLAGLGLAACSKEPDPSYFDLHHVHAVGCDESNGNISVHRLTLISSDGQIYTDWLYDSPKCDVWKMSEWWDVGIKITTFGTHYLTHLTTSK